MQLDLSPPSKPFRRWGCCTEVRRCDGGGCSSTPLRFPLPSPLKCKYHTRSSYHRRERRHKERVSSKREGDGTSIGAPQLRASPPCFWPPKTAPLLLKSTTSKVFSPLASILNFWNVNVVERLLAATVTEFSVTAIVTCVAATAVSNNYRCSSGPPELIKPPTEPCFGPSMIEAAISMGRSLLSLQSRRSKGCRSLIIVADWELTNHTESKGWVSDTICIDSSPARVNSRLLNLNEKNFSLCRESIRTKYLYPDSRESILSLPELIVVSNYFKIWYFKAVVMVSKVYSWGSVSGLWGFKPVFSKGFAKSDRFRKLDWGHG
ncbi:hypothetical protein PIB30_047306 [Stylosanthes scabra]|uniref:Uncharacterized protein n=1 Tax=Stylosanthes scabra TaxID=79078 RepID=A0ABU6YEZ1_9FABA|nr:hypothetical protein [Stylosanthes scabra]